MAIRMADVHFADAPGHVGGRPSYFDVLCQTVLVKGVDIVDPDRHPYTPIAGFAAVAEGGGVCALTTPSLPTNAQEYLEMAAAHRAECRRSTPVESLLKAEFLEPLEALLDIGDVQDGRDMLNVHGRNSNVARRRFHHREHGVHRERMSNPGRDNEGLSESDMTIGLATQVVRFNCV